ncbi:XK-related protein 6-like [Ctenocephalides felis]|uniref:XK-related protein 6-like n=1 Tax=Ctenocephalides felis TaxID=7515 RepID=UPI000E6E2D14|nr:XK-related protein 6-like [Ctenocephalides felis]
MTMRVIYDTNLEWCGTEDVDSTPSNFSVTNLDIIGLIYSIIAHLVDAGVDIYLACYYFSNSNYDYFAWTVVFIAVPAVINTCISLTMYAEDAHNLNQKRSTPCLLIKSKGNRCLGAFQIFMHILQLATVARCCDSLKFAFASRHAEKKNDRKEQKLQYENMLKEDSDISLLRLIECFLESAPQ